MTQYPAKIDTSITLPSATDNITPVNAALFNKLRSAILAIESSLGTNPAGMSNVKERLNTLEAGNSISLTNDLGGTTSSPKVIGIQGNPITDDTPGSNTVMVWDGSIWNYETLFQSATGDVSGTYPALAVNDLTITDEEQGSILYYNGTNWSQLAPIADGYLLTSGGAAANPVWTVYGYQFFIWQPGGTNYGNIRTSFTDVVSLALASTPGVATILLDDSQGPLTLPTSTNVDCQTRIKFVADHDVTLTFGAGATITDAAAFIGMHDSTIDFDITTGTSPVSVINFTNAMTTADRSPYFENCTQTLSGGSRNWIRFNNITTATMKNCIIDNCTCDTLTLTLKGKNRGWVGNGLTVGTSLSVNGDPLHIRTYHPITDPLYAPETNTALSGTTLATETASTTSNYARWDFPGATDAFVTLPVSLPAFGIPGYIRISLEGTDFSSAGDIMYWEYAIRRGETIYSSVGNVSIDESFFSGSPNRLTFIEGLITTDFSFALTAGGIMQEFQFGRLGSHVNDTSSSAAYIHAIIVEIY